MEKTLKTPKGAEIVVHYEGKEAEEKWDRVPFDKQCTIIKEGLLVQKNDTGKKTTMHLLINNELCLKMLTADEYADWQNAEPDWFHYRESIRRLVKEILPVIRISEMFGSGFSRGFGPFGLGFMSDPFDFPGDIFASLEGRFKGPSDDFLNMINRDKKMLDAATAVSKNNHEGCVMCIKSSCLIRRANFDEARFTTALTAFKKDTAGAENAASSEQKTTSAEDGPNKQG